jgi:hypothetical protein
MDLITALHAAVRRRRRLTEPEVRANVEHLVEKGHLILHPDGFRIGPFPGLEAMRKLSEGEKTVLLMCFAVIEKRQPLKQLVERLTRCPQ